MTDSRKRRPSEPRDSALSLDFAETNRTVAEEDSDGVVDLVDVMTAKSDLRRSKKPPWCT
jgi:hypothetical protein